MIEKVPKIKEPMYEINFSINSEFIKKFIKAKKALGDIQRFTIESSNKIQDHIDYRIIII